MSNQSPLRPSDRNVLWLCAAACLLLLIIGVRFVVWPSMAARSFGVEAMPRAFELHRVVGVRDIWIAALGLGLVWFRLWRGIALWFGFGAVVCFVDAAIVFQVMGKSLQLTFHVVSGLVCAALAAATWARADRL